MQSVKYCTCVKDVVVGTLVLVLKDSQYITNTQVTSAVPVVSSGGGLVLRYRDDAKRWLSQCAVKVCLSNKCRIVVLHSVSPRPFLASFLLDSNPSCVSSKRSVVPTPRKNVPTPFLSVPVAIQGGAFIDATKRPSRIGWVRVAVTWDGDVIQGVSVDWFRQLAVSCRMAAQRRKEMMSMLVAADR